MSKKRKYAHRPFVSLRSLFSKNKNLKENLDVEQPKKEAKGSILFLGYIGLFLVIAGVIDLIPLIVCLIYQEFNRMLAFAIPGLVSIAAGIPLTTLLRDKTKAKLGKHQDLLLLICIWLVCSFICALPFMMPTAIGGLQIGFVRSMFESISGFATCGLTILTPESGISPSVLLQNGGRSFLFFRAFIMLIGGIGFVLVLTTFINDAFGIKLYGNEGHTDRLLPNVYKSSQLILILYIGVCFVGSVALWLAGMNPWTTINLPAGCEGDPTTSSYFEALCFSMALLSTGGFSTRDLSIYAFNNINVEIVSLIIMILGGTNFVIIYSLITLKFGKVYKDVDCRMQFIFSMIYIPLMIILSSFSKTMTGDTLDLWQKFRYNIYLFFTAITTTGTMNAPSVYAMATPATFFIVILLMSTGTQQGSTTGGIKLSRFSITFKSIYWTLKERNNNRNMISPHYVYKFGDTKEITEKDMKDSTSYIFIYLIVFIVLAFLISIGLGDQNFDFLQVLFETSSALGDSGISSGITSFSQNNFVLIVLTIAMFLGRLELYTFIYGGTGFINNVKAWSKSAFKFSKDWLDKKISK